jgi:hypothetical protein
MDDPVHTGPAPDNATSQKKQSTTERVVSANESFATIWAADIAKMEERGAMYRGRGRPIVRDTVHTKRGDSAGWISNSAGEKTLRDQCTAGLQKLKKNTIKYIKFMGPGFLVSVAYIDPGTPISIPMKSNH